MKSTSIQEIRAEAPERTGHGGGRQGYLGERARLPAFDQLTVLRRHKITGQGRELFDLRKWEHLENIYLGLPKKVKEKVGQHRD